MKLAHCHTDWNTQLHRRGYRPRLLLKRLCLGKESYLSLLRITPDVELLPLYNQRHNMVATWLKTNNMPLNDWKTTRTKPTKNSKVTRLLRFNANLTAHYWHSRRQTPLTPNTTIDSGTQYHSHRNFTVCRNYTNLVSQCDQLFPFCGSPTYQLSKYLTTILQPLTDKSRRKLQSTEDFINATKTVQIPDDYKLVSFDVKSLFTSIPLQLALQCTETAILQSTDPLLLPTEDIMDLLNLCLTSTYFQYNGKHYKQLHGTAIGSPVSVFVAEIEMQNIEESAFTTCRQTIPL